MIEKFKSYFAKLERLSIAELDRSAEKLVVAEHGNIARLIAHIAEMSARKAALEHRCSNRLCAGNRSRRRRLLLHRGTRRNRR